MDPVTLIVMALAADAGSAVRAEAPDSVTGAYERLMDAVRVRLAGHPSGEVALARYQADPQAGRALLAAELARAGAGNDAGLAAAALAVMELVDVAGAEAGKYAVAISGSHGALAGDHNTQVNYFFGTYADRREAAEAPAGAGIVGVGDAPQDPAASQPRAGLTGALEQESENRERPLGADHPDTLTSHNNLAAAYKVVGACAVAAVTAVVVWAVFFAGSSSAGPGAGPGRVPSAGQSSKGRSIASANTSLPTVTITQPLPNAVVKPCTTVTFKITGLPPGMAFVLGISIPEHNAWHFTADGFALIRPNVWSKTQSLGDSHYGKGAPFVIGVYIMRKSELDGPSSNETTPWDPQVPPADAIRLASRSVVRNTNDLSC